MLALLAAGDFDGVYAAIGRLEQIHRPHPTLEEDSSDRFNKLLVFEKEITEICSTEADTHSPAAVLSRGHGIVRPRLGSQVLRLAYVSPHKTAGPELTGTPWVYRYHSPTQNDPAETLAAATERLFGAVDTAYVDIMVADASTTMDTLPPSEKLATCIAAPRGSEDGATSVLTFEAYAGPPDTLFTLSLLPAQPVFCHTEIAMDIFEVAYGRPPSHGGADAGRMGVAGPRDFLSAVIEQSGGPAAGSPFHFYPRKGCSGGVMLERVDIRSTRQLLAVLQRLRQQLVVNALLKSCVQAASAGSVQAAELSLVGPGHITLQLQHPVTERLCSVDISVQINGDVGCRITTLPSDPAPCSDADFLSALQDRLSIPEALEKTWAGTERAPKRSRTET